MIGTYFYLDGINIVTDVMHGWRKNAKDTSVDAIGEGLFNVLIMQRSDMVFWL